MYIVGAPKDGGAELEGPGVPVEAGAEGVEAPLLLLFVLTGLGLAGVSLSESLPESPPDTIQKF